MTNKECLDILIEAAEELVRHDEKNDQREGLPSCLELQRLRDAIYIARRGEPELDRAAKAYSKGREDLIHELGFKKSRELKDVISKLRKTETSLESKQKV